MNFTDFDKELAKEFDNLNQREAKRILYFLQKQMAKKIRHGTEISIREIGILILRVREPKKYLDFQSGEVKNSKRKYTLSLRVSRAMSKFLRSKTVYGYENSQKKV